MEQAHSDFWVVVEVELLRRVALHVHVKYLLVAVAVMIVDDYEQEEVEVLPLAFFLPGKEVERQTSALSLSLHLQVSLEAVVGEAVQGLLGWTMHVVGSEALELKRVRIYLRPRLVEAL